MISTLILKLESLATFFITMDRDLFYGINQIWTNATFDQFMPWITNLENTKWLLFLFVIWMIVRLKKKALIVIFGCAFSILVADVTAARVIKPLMTRPRPQFSEPHVRLLVPSQASYGFPSNHASNAFAVATFLGLAVMGLGPLATILAAIIGYSRIYVGVHYPLDVIGGALVGMISGIFVYYSFRIAGRIIFPKKLRDLPKEWSKKRFERRKGRRQKIMPS